MATLGLRLTFRGLPRRCRSDRWCSPSPSGCAYCLYRRRLLGEIARVAAHTVTAAIRTRTDERGLAIGIVACLQTHGLHANWHPHLQQLPDGSIAIGGFRDRAGPSEWSPDARPTEPVQPMLETFMRQHLGVHAPITHRWAASAAFSDNGLPILEHVRDGI